MTILLYIALTFIVAAMLAIVLELLVRDAADLKRRAEQLKQLGFRQVAEYDAGVEKKRLP